MSAEGWGLKPTYVHARLMNQRTIFIYPTNKRTRKLRCITRIPNGGMQYNPRSPMFTPTSETSGQYSHIRRTNAHANSAASPESRTEAYSTIPSHLPRDDIHIFDEQTHTQTPLHRQNPERRHAVQICSLTHSLTANGAEGWG